jgi:hypothetical protein
MLAVQSSPNNVPFYTPKRQRPEEFIQNVTRLSPYRRPPPSPRYTQPARHVSLASHPSSHPSIINAKYDVRKPDDPMPFSLRDVSTGKVRAPTDEEFIRIQEEFPQCTGYRIFSPILILQCPEPPTSTPLTVGGLPTVFVPVLREYDPLGGRPGNPTLPDLGGDAFRVDESRYPTFKLVEDALLLLSQHYPNIVRLQFKYNFWIVRVSSSNFDPFSYPGKFGRRTVVYTWPGQEKRHGPPRLTPFGSVRGDVTDYRAFGLSPGVKVVGEKMATSSGIVMQNGQLRRLSLALHGFEDTDDVFHPDPLPQSHLGTIDIRIPWIDVALCVMDERVTFTNKSYFTANPPKRLVTTQFVDSKLGVGTWFEAEGYTSERVHMFYSGPAVQYYDARVRDGEAYELTQLRRSRQYVLENLGPDVGDAQEGLCGAPVVHEQTEDEEMDGIVLGFVWLKDDKSLVVAAVDYLVDDGWEVASV